MMGKEHEITHLELGDAHSCNEPKHDAEEAADHGLGQRGKDAAKFACKPGECTVRAPAEQRLGVVKREDEAA